MRMNNSLKMMVSFNEFIADKHPNLIDRLKLFIALCKKIRRCHAKQMVHNDINLDICQVDPATGEVEIPDSNLTEPLSESKERGPLSISRKIKGPLAFISPERTGRTAHPVDFRSDGYSLGIVLYQLLTDTLPFAFEQPQAMIHAHIAVPPIPAAKVNPKIPQLLSDIASKLLAKTPADRYQSTAGLIFDLKTALEQLETTGRIDNFPLARRDVSPFFEIPNKLYGRYREIQLLGDARKRVSKGHVEVIFFNGPPGIGKSFLVDRIHFSLQEDGGYFISGKFDQYEKSLPYSAIAQAFSGLMQRLLTLNETELEKRRKAILEVVGRNGQLIIDVIPELELVIGKQPQPEKLSAPESRYRFTYLFQNFVRSLTSQTAPLIIFIDDLQWADHASLDLIQAVLLDHALTHVLFIGAYRNIEATDNPFLPRFFKGISRHHLKPQLIPLQPVNSEYIGTLIKDMLSVDLDHTGDFLQVITEKTGCNPLFIKEFLISLHKEGLIRFIQTEGNIEKDRWRIDLQAILKAKLPETIVSLLTQRIRKLSAETQDILKIAACIGTRFSPDLVTAVHGKAVETIHTRLKEARDQGIIIPTQEGFQFIHDRVRETAYELNSVEKRAGIHYAVGKTLMSDPPQALSNHIFLLVSQLNSARPLLTADERLKLTQLNLTAGQKAKKVTAFTIARDYFAAGLELIDESNWESHYELMLPLHTEAAETAYMCAEFDEAKQLVRTVLKNARTDLDQVAAYDIHIRCLFSQSRFSEILHEGLVILNRLGYKIPCNPGRLRILWEFFALKWALRKKTPEELKETHQAQDPILFAQHRISSAISSTAYRTRPNLFKFLVFNNLRRFLKQGIVPDSAVYFSFYGLLLGRSGKIDRGYNFGQLALALSDHPQIHPNVKTQILLQVNGLILLWKRHFRDTLPPLLEAFNFCMETGNIAATPSMISLYFNNLVACGAPLKEIVTQIDHYHDILRQFRQESALEYLGILRSQLSAYFIGPNPSIPQSQYNNIDENAFLNNYTITNDKFPLSYFYFAKLAGNYYLGNYLEAIKYADLAYNSAKRTPPSVITLRLRFLDSLARLALIRMNALETKVEKRRLCHNMIFFCLKKYYRIKIAANQRDLKRWCRHTPMNILNKWSLVEAERADADGQVIKAEKHYHQAIELSRKYDFLSEEALSHELLARFYLRNSQKRRAEEHLQTAIALNEKWGAGIQHRRLLEDYQALFGRPAETSEDKNIATDDRCRTASRQGVTLAEMDLQLFSDVMDTISDNISIKKRLALLSKHMMRHLGAQRVSLLIIKKRLLIGVDNEVGKKPVMLRPVTSDLPFPESVIQYVIRTQNMILLDHAAKAEIFSIDPYIRKHRVKSMICLPLMYQNKLDALLYLENNLSSGAFTPQHVEILIRLGGQLALFLEKELLRAPSSVTYSSILPIEKLIAVLQDRYGLTPQEAKIAALFREGHTRKQICQTLEISTTTLKKHLQTIFSKTVNLEEKYTNSGRVDKLSRLILFLFKQSDPAEVLHSPSDPFIKAPG